MIGKKKKRQKQMPSSVLCGCQKIKKIVGVKESVSDKIINRKIEEFNQESRTRLVL